MTHSFRILLNIERKILKTRLLNPRSTHALLLLANPLNILLLLPRVILRRVFGEKRMESAVYRKVLKLYGLTYLILRFLVPKQRDLVVNTRWDLLIILDACRYDYFSVVLRRYFSKELKGAISVCYCSLSAGTETDEFLENVFDGKVWGDCIYISANPFVSASFGRYNPQVFYLVIPVWDYGFDPNLNTVLPQRVLHAWLQAVLMYTNSKRYIVHFIQPHFPTICRYLRIPSANPEYVLRVVREGKKSVYFLKAAYFANLVLCMKEVIKLLKLAKLLGFKRAVITSDHGDLVELGGHPYGTYVADLCLVPWVEVDLEKIQISEDELVKLQQLIVLGKHLTGIKHVLKVKLEYKDRVRGRLPTTKL